MVLYAEHGFDVSTFVARVVISTGSDIYSAVAAAAGALNGSAARWRERGGDA
ncbi:2-methylcitrate synthase [Mycobacterium pseudokansasii]|uniref:2-methylcitrate synthase n=1 Tax=Mycobacterium pseudokansasii TaxID=2341080 RepID=A0A498QMK3_9MYCO|nr:2-methylcitrate synthase [Mycobacterium pseudokansasii]VAZ92286.1 2-methylcitrate synthase [Mycobacterium pseudokansasii]VBA48561.1 2-methylcitrate synthase [Mycobacterium pseudokansasii]